MADLQEDIDASIEQLGNQLAAVDINAQQIAQQALFNGADWLLPLHGVPLLFFIAANLAAAGNRLRLLAALLCELLNDMRNQGTLNDVGVADGMIAQMMDDHQLVHANQLYPQLGPNHTGGMLWHWTQLSSVLQYFIAYFPQLMNPANEPVYNYWLDLLRTAIYKDLIDNFCNPGIRRIFFQEEILAFMSTVCDLLLVKMASGHLLSHPLAVAALTAARDAYVDVIHFTWQPRFRALMIALPAEDPRWRLRPEIGVAHVIPPVVPPHFAAQHMGEGEEVGVGEGEDVGEGEEMEDEEGMWEDEGMEGQEGQGQ